MKITKLHIHNYRNLDDIKVSFAEDCNFIVGENNLGKSNLLYLLNIIFSHRSFNYDDFSNPSKPIEVIVQLKLSDIEIGHFQDLFESSDYSLINIQCLQPSPDDYIEFYHSDSSTYIDYKLIRCINFIHYDSLRNPTSEINFDRGRGVGRFLTNIISDYLNTKGKTTKDFIDESKLTELLKDINSKIKKIKSFNDFSINAVLDDDLDSLLPKMVTMRDEKGESLTKTGYGVQYLLLVMLSILDKLQRIKVERKGMGIFENEATGTKSISLIIGLDEPEIHLHPYMQRSLIKYINSIINNKTTDFKQLIKELFDIDEFIGQVIVVTHSPNIILNDYKQIVRLFSEKSITKIISGSNLSLGEQLHKHLYLHFPFIKEAFFSRCAIFVEGDSEYASFPHFGQKLSIDFDDLGICVIQAGGDAIPQLIELATKFGIPSVGITDKDDGTRTITLPNHFQTTKRDFEEEIISLIDSGNESILREIMFEYDSKKDQRVMNMEALNKRAYAKYNVTPVAFTTSLKLSDIVITDTQNLKAYYLTWYAINKSYPLGKIIGEKLPEALIPNVFINVIKEAKKLAVNA